MSTEEERQMPEPDYDDRREGPPDRRYYAPAPRETNWPVIFTALITILIAMVGYTATVMNDLKREIRATADLQLRFNSTWESERTTIRRDLDAAQNKIDTIVLAFQYNVNGRLNYLEYKTGFKAPKESIQPPQQPQLQGD